MDTLNTTLALLLIVALFAAALFWSRARYLRRRRDDIERQRDRAWRAVEQIMALIEQGSDPELFHDADSIVDRMWERE